MPGHEYVLMLTQRCNFRCSYCYQQHAPVDQERQVVERLAAHLRARHPAGMRLVFHGGEPLLRKDLLLHAVSLLADERGQPVCELGIVTNGSLIDAEMLALFSRHHFRVSVSFDGCREAQAFRDPGSFDHLVATLRELVRLHGEGRLELEVAITVSLDNLPHLSRSVAFLTELGVPTIQIEGDLFGPWVEGSQQEVDRQVEQVVQQMERRVAAGLPVPVARLRPRPHDPAGTWWETAEERRALRETRLAGPECGCGAAGSSLIHPDGSTWACPLFVPDLGRVAAGRVADREAFRRPSWEQPGPARVQHEPILGPKRSRRSIFSECASCPHVTDCSVCPAASHLPDAEKPAGEVPPLLCRLNMAFLSRRDRIRRPPTFLDVLLSVAGGRAAGVTAAREA